MREPQRLKGAGYVFLRNIHRQIGLRKGGETMVHMRNGQANQKRVFVLSEMKDELRGEAAPVVDGGRRSVPSSRLTGETLKRDNVQR